MDNATSFDPRDYVRQQEALNRAEQKERRESLDQFIGGIVGEDSLALWFAKVHAETLRYVAPWGQWLRWNGSRWAPDNTLAVFDLARGLCRDVAAQAAAALSEGEERRLQDSKTIAAVERLSKSDRRLAATVDQWDADHWLLATPDDTVDLRNGTMRASSRADFITKCTATTPDFDADCPRWLAFLDRVTDGYADLVKYLQRLAGYSLTGSTREHTLERNELRWSR